MYLHHINISFDHIFFCARSIFKSFSSYIYRTCYLHIEFVQFKIILYGIYLYTFPVRSFNGIIFVLHFKIFILWMNHHISNFNGIIVVNYIPMNLVILKWDLKMLFHPGSRLAAASHTTDATCLGIRALWGLNTVILKSMILFIYAISTVYMFNAPGVLLNIQNSVFTSHKYFFWPHFLLCAINFQII